jgi:hypothetical protein
MAFLKLRESYKWLLKASWGVYTIFYFRFPEGRKLFYKIEKPLNNADMV